jgi:hypothetical protein
VRTNLNFIQDDKSGKLVLAGISHSCFQLFLVVNFVDL